MPKMQKSPIDTLPEDGLVEHALDVLDEYLSRRGLKRSSQRSTVLQVFLSADDCITIQQLYDRVREDAPSISYTTVYRSLTLFTRCGLAIKTEYLDGTARFGHCFNRCSHHQVICTVCGHSVDFAAPETEWIERRIEKQLRYVTILHNLQIYGICENCQNDNERVELAMRNGRSSI